MRAVEENGGSGIVQREELAELGRRFIKGFSQSYRDL